MKNIDYDHFYEPPYSEVCGHMKIKIDLFKTDDRVELTITQSDYYYMDFKEGCSLSFNFENSKASYKEASYLIHSFVETLHKAYRNIIDWNSLSYKKKDELKSDLKSDLRRVFDFQYVEQTGSFIVDDNLTCNLRGEYFDDFVKTLERLANKFKRVSTFWSFITAYNKVYKCLCLPFIKLLRKNTISEVRDLKNKIVRLESDLDHQKWRFSQLKKRKEELVKENVECHELLLKLREELACLKNSNSK